MKGFEKMVLEDSALTSTLACDSNLGIGHYAGKGGEIHPAKAGNLRALAVLFRSGDLTCRSLLDNSIVESKTLPRF